MVDTKDLLRDYQLTRKYRSEFLKLLFEILMDRYHVDYKKLARAIERNPNYIYQWLQGYTVIGHQVMDDLEIYLKEVYNPILQDEIDAHLHIVQDIRKKNEEYLDRYKNSSIDKQKEMKKYITLG